MNNKTDIEEDIKESFNRIETIIKQEVCLFNQTVVQGNINQIKRYIENILADRERLEEKANKYDSLVEKIKELKCNLDKDGFVGYADEITDILEELEGE